MKLIWKAELDFTRASEILKLNRNIVTYSGRWPKSGRTHDLQAPMDFEALGKVG